MEDEEDSPGCDGSNQDAVDFKSVWSRLPPKGAEPIAFALHTQDPASGRHLDPVTLSTVLRAKTVKYLQLQLVDPDSQGMPSFGLPTAPKLNRPLPYTGYCTHPVLPK